MISALCAQLDRLPLAIELAAASARSMSLTDLTNRLGDRFRLLRGQRRAAERHQTLRATVAWSYDLLTPHEQRLFDRLSVFVGGFDLTAAEAVCGGEDLDAWDIDELLMSLVDKSMILTGASGRYLLLETLRQFGEERLATTDDPDRFRDRHRQYFTEFAVVAHDGVQGAEQVVWLQRLHADWANLRTALNRATTTSNIESAATIAVYSLWAATWHDSGEPFVWIETAARIEGAPSHPMWPNVLAGRAWAAFDSGDPATALDLGFKALDAEDGGAPIVDHWAHSVISSAALYLRQHDLADEFITQNITLSHNTGRSTLQAIFVAQSATSHTFAGRFEQALDAARTSQQLAAMTGNPNAIAWALGQEGVALAALHNPAAQAVFERGLTLARDTGSVLAATDCERELAILFARTGAVDEAARLVRHALQAMRQRSAWMYAHETLYFAATILAGAGDAETAAALYGSFSSSSAAGAQGFARRSLALQRRLVAALGRDQLERLATTGETMSPERAVAVAEIALANLLAD